MYIKYSNTNLGAGTVDRLCCIKFFPNSSNASNPGLSVLSVACVAPFVAGAPDDRIFGWPESVMEMKYCF